MDSILLHNAAQIVSPKPGVMRGPELKQLSVHKNSSLFIEDGVIQAIGPAKQMEERIAFQTRVVDVSGKCLLPGFVDAHTHLVFGGSREDEFARRCVGASYAELAQQGGGIMSTVRATRQMSKEQLIRQGLVYLQKAVHHGITTMEIKSGYGLDEANELKILQVIKELHVQQPVELIATFLGAHAVPTGVTKVDYLEQLHRMLPQVASLAQFCDVFCERDYFTADETRDILREAARFGLKSRVHTNQFHSIGGIQAAIDAGAASVDHLEHLSDAEIAALAATDMCATLLPGVSLFLNIPYAPGRKILDAGCIPVLATDFNPGSCMTLSMPMILTLACTQMGFSMEEAIAAVTQNAAYSLGLEKIGCLEPGWQADVLILDSDNYQNLIYFFAEPQIEQVMKKGQFIYDRSLAWDIGGDLDEESDDAESHKDLFA
ncbi:MAG TPA: imidazolonepropionase [bacterium]|nr:imidazolonepropionase [bacterium]HPN45961.1 imidazolonepropionase [bacterium]